MTSNKQTFNQFLFRRLALPCLETYADRVLEHRLTTGWKKSDVFTDLCKVFQTSDGKQKVLQLICVVPCTPNFWSAWLAMYLIFAPDVFKSHRKICKYLLHEVNERQFHIKNLTDNFLVLKWLQESAAGIKENNYLDNPALCVVNMRNEILVCQGEHKNENDLGRPDKELFYEIHRQWVDIKSKWDSGERDDGQSQGTGEHCVERQRGPGAGDVHCILGGERVHEDAKDPTHQLHESSTQDLRAIDIDPDNGERSERVVGRHQC